MLHFFKFSAEVPAPVPARETYRRRSPGKGWPEQCPPLRAASAFGWDVLAATDMVFRKKKGAWELADPVDLESDWAYHGPAAGGEGARAGRARKGKRREAKRSGGVPLVQRNAWFWDRDQILPHVISKDVYPRIANQVKVSTFLFLYTDPNELLLMTGIPNLERPFRVFSALLDTDWYPASYPWHCVIELEEGRSEVKIARGDPLCRLFTVPRGDYFAREMTVPEFERFFQRTQEWLLRHSRGEVEGTMDITGAYVRQQRLSRFSVIL